MEIITKEQLDRWFTQKENMVIIGLLSKGDFCKRNIPLSINIPFKDDTAFITEVEKYVPSKDARIIVYCNNCESGYSKKAAEKLDQAGFANVYHFADGLEGWFMHNDNDDEVKINNPLQ